MLSILILLLEIPGIVLTYQILSFSIKRKSLNCIEWGAGCLFRVSLGWTAANMFTIGIAPIIYYTVKRKEIIATAKDFLELTLQTRPEQPQSLFTSESTRTIQDHGIIHE